MLLNGLKTRQEWLNTASLQRKLLSALSGGMQEHIYTQAHNSLHPGPGGAKKAIRKLQSPFHLLLSLFKICGVHLAGCPLQWRALLQPHGHGLKVSFPPHISSDKGSCLPVTTLSPSGRLLGLEGSGMDWRAPLLSAKWPWARLAFQGTANTAIHASLPQSDADPPPLRSRCVFPSMLEILCTSEMCTCVCVVDYKLGLSGFEWWRGLIPRAWILSRADRRSSWLVGTAADQSVYRWIHLIPWHWNSQKDG